MAVRCTCKKVRTHTHHANLILPVTIILQYPYRITFFTIRFAISLEEFAINPFLAAATFKAFLMVDFPKGCTTFHAHGLPTNSTNTWNGSKLTKWFLIECFSYQLTNTSFNSLCHSISNFCLDFGIIQIKLGHIRIMTSGAVISRFVPRICRNGSVHGWNLSAWRFAFGRHLDASVSNSCLSCGSTWLCGSSARWWRWRSWPSGTSWWWWSWTCGWSCQSEWIWGKFIRATWHHQHLHESKPLIYSSMYNGVSSKLKWFLIEMLTQLFLEN